MEQNDKKADMAILKIAFVLTSFSDQSNMANRQIFGKIAKNFSWYAPGQRETDDFMLESIETTKDLNNLKSVYSEEDFFKAFISRLEKDCSTLKNDSSETVRKAFVVWLGICLADNVFNTLEQKAVKILQAYFNSKDSLLFKGTIGAILGSAVLAASTSILPLVFAGTTLMVGSTLKRSLPKNVLISDEFLANALDAVKTLGELANQIENETDVEMKRNLQQSYDIFKEDLHSMILNDPFETTSDTSSTQQDI